MTNKKLNKKKSKILSKNVNSAQKTPKMRLPKAKDPSKLGGGLIGVVTSRFNSEVTDKLKEGALARLSELGFSESQILVCDVPGAYEIPLAAKLMLKNGVKGVIALGAVIRGETTHYDYVCSSVERGCSKLQLKYTKPVVFGVLTTENEEQALDRVGGAHGHKGRDAADTLAEMLGLVQVFKNKKSNKNNVNKKEKSYAGN